MIITTDDVVVALRKQFAYIFLNLPDCKDGTLIKEFVENELSASYNLLHCDVLIHELDLLWFMMLEERCQVFEFAVC